jgi:enoyl-CoA hydratase/carnithine racemase
MKHGIQASMVVLHLMRLVGERVARYLLLTGELIPARRAMAIGLVNEVVAPDKLIETALGWADMIATNGPKAEATTKSLLCRFSDQATAMGMTEYVGAPHVTDEARDSLKAFSNREPVPWIPKSRADPQT